MCENLDVVNKILPKGFSARYLRGMYVIRYEERDVYYIAITSSPINELIEIARIIRNAYDLGYKEGAKR